MTSLIAEEIGDNNKNGMTNTLSPGIINNTNNMELIEYDVNNDEELKRIRNSIQNMDINGGVYTGEPPIDMTPSKIKSIPNLVVELEKRAGSKDVWEMRAEQVYNAFTSPKPPSKEEFFELMENLMPLTTEQTEDAVSLLSQRSKVSKRIAFGGLSSRRGISSFSPSSSPSKSYNRSNNKYNSNDDFFDKMLNEASNLSSGRKRTTKTDAIGNTIVKNNKRTNVKSFLNNNNKKNYNNNNIAIEQYKSKTPSLHELATGNSAVYLNRNNRDNNMNDINNNKKNNEGSTKIEIKTPSADMMKKSNNSNKKNSLQPQSFNSPNTRLSLVDLLTSSPRNVKDENLPNHLLSALRRHIRRRALTIPSLFAMWDKTRDGLLTKRNLKNGLLNLGIETTTEEINRFFDYLDDEGTGRITLKRFMRVLKYKTRFGSPNPYILTGKPGTKDDGSNNKEKSSEVERKNNDVSGKGSKLLDAEEARVASIYRRLSMTETKSSKEWLQLKAEDRLLGDGGRDHRGAEDPTPRALLAKIRARMKRRTLQTSQFFSYCDKDRGGEISEMELANGMKYLGMELTSKQLKTLWKVMDIDGDGRISFMEFKLAIDVAGSGPTMALINHEEEGGDTSGTFAPILRACVMPLRLEKLRQKLRAAAYVWEGENLQQLFEKLDIHKEGYLPAQRFKQIIKSIYPMKTEELNAVYKLTDKKSKGKVSYEDFENFIHGEGGVAPNGLVIKQKAKPKPKEKNLGEILISMQKQQQRTILLNPPLFSGIYVSENSDKGVKQLLLQFRLIGFDITAKDAKKILDTFGTEKSSFKLLHSILVAKKIIASSYISNLDELIRRFEKYDHSNNGIVSIKNFEKVLNQVIELNAVESKLLLRILDYNDSNSVAYKHLFEFSRDEIDSLEIPPPEMKSVELLKPRNDSIASNLTMKLMRLKHLVSRSDAAGGQLNLKFLRKMDRNMDGILTREELYKGVDHEAKLDGVYMTNEQVEEVLEILDAKKSGIIKLSKLEIFEKLDLIRCKLKANTYSHDGKDPTSIFRLISRGEEEIDLDDFIETLNRICHLSGGELGMLLHQVDVNDDGTINKDEFATFLKDIRVLE